MLNTLLIVCAWTLKIILALVILYFVFLFLLLGTKPHGVITQCSDAARQAFGLPKT
jgi:hypothetical protein